MNGNFTKRINDLHPNRPWNCRSLRYNYPQLKLAAHLPLLIAIGKNAFVALDINTIFDSESSCINSGNNFPLVWQTLGVETVKSGEFIDRGQCFDPMWFRT